MAPKQVAPRPPPTPRRPFPAPPPGNLLEGEVEECVVEIPLQDVPVRLRLHGQQPVDLACLQRFGVGAHQEEAAQLDAENLALTTPTCAAPAPGARNCWARLNHQQQEDRVRTLVGRHFLEQREVAASLYSRKSRMCRGCPAKSGRVVMEVLGRQGAGGSEVVRASPEPLGARGVPFQVGAGGR